MITVDHNLDALNRILPEYQRTFGKTTTEVLVKQGTKLAIALHQRLKELAPGKGSIRAERMAALKAGEGVLVRPGIAARVMSQQGTAVPLSARDAYRDASKRTERKIGALTGLRFKFGKRSPQGKASIKQKGKRLNLRALMVQAEINAREGGRNYLGWAAKTSLRGLEIVKALAHFGKYKQQLAAVGLGVNELGQELRFTYGGFSAGNGRSVGVGEAMQKPKAQQKISTALADIVADVRKGIRDRQAQQLAQSTKAAIAAARTVTA